jgi:flagellar biosynthesis protein FlhF
MNVQTYRAASIREALDLVRRELGGDAIILSTREVPAQRRFPWQRRLREAEVVAGLAEQTASLRNSRVATRHIAVLPAGHGATSADHQPGAAPSRHTSRGLPHGGAGPRNADVQAQSADAYADLIAQLSARTARRERAEIPVRLFHAYARLIDADVDEQDARQLLEELQTAADPIETADSQRLRNALSEQIERTILCTGPIEAVPGRRTVAALVGPTGVGKTTTIAKLAANFKLRDKARVGLVTVDTYRVAAVEQLRTYAEIIDLPMRVVASPGELRHAIDQLGDMDLVLIDTAGRSPRDELRIQELRSFLSEADVDQVHLVLSLATGVRTNELTAERFRSVGVTSMLLTKLDEAAGPGAIVSAARRIQLPISYLTTGQNVPDDIEPADARRAAQLVLSAEAPAISAASKMEDRESRIDLPSPSSILRPRSS